MRSPTRKWQVPVHTRRRGDEQRIGVRGDRPAAHCGITNAGRLTFTRERVHAGRADESRARSTAAHRQQGRITCPYRRNSATLLQQILDAILTLPTVATPQPPA